MYVSIYTDSQAHVSPDTDIYIYGYVSACACACISMHFMRRINFKFPVIVYYVVNLYMIYSDKFCCLRSVIQIMKIKT